MGESNTLKVYVFFMVIFFFFTGATELSNEDFDLNKYMPIHNQVTKAKDFKLEAEQYQQSAESLLSSVFSTAQVILAYGSIIILSILSVFDYLILILGLISVSFGILPQVFTVLLFTPLVVVIIIEYIIPTFRGN